MSKYTYAMLKTILSDGKFFRFSHNRLTLEQVHENLGQLLYNSTSATQVSNGRYIFLGGLDKGESESIDIKISVDGTLDALQKGS